jgi:hypothetical protein
MKLKVAKRTASEYEESLSSQGSCGESAVARAAREDRTGDSSRGSSIMLLHECWTPRKPSPHEQQFSIEKLVSNVHHEWEGSEEQGKRGSLWRCGSEDSKIRSKEDNSS